MMNTYKIAFAHEGYYEDQDHTVTATTAEAAAEAQLEELHEWLSAGDWGEVGKTLRIEGTVYATAADDEDDEASASTALHIDPEEPECDEAVDGTHRWVDDPTDDFGCRGMGGASVRSWVVCSFCGLVKVHQTASQGYESTYDYDRTWYEDDDGPSLEQLAELHDGHPENLRDDSIMAGLIARNAMDLEGGH